METIKDNEGMGHIDGSIRRTPRMILDEATRRATFNFVMEMCLQLAKNELEMMEEYLVWITLPEGQSFLSSLGSGMPDCEWERERCEEMRALIQELEETQAKGCL